MGLAPPPARLATTVAPASWCVGCADIDKLRPFSPISVDDADHVTALTYDSARPFHQPDRVEHLHVRACTRLPAIVRQRLNITAAMFDEIKERGMTGMEELL